MALSEPTIRGLKQAARIALAAAMANIIIALQSGGKLEPKAVAFGAIIAAYEGVSKYIATNPDIDLKGLYPF